MSLIIDGAGVCTSLLLNLSEVIGENASPTRGLSAGALAAVYDPDNVRQGPQVNDISMRGHQRTARVMYKRPTLLGDVSDVPTDLCFEGEVNPYVEDLVEIDKYKEKTGSVDIATVRTFCEELSNLENIGLVIGNNASVTDILSRGESQTSLSVIRELAQSILFDRRAMLEAIDLDIVNSIVAGAGTLEGGGSGTYDVLNNDGSPNAAGIGQMLQDISNLGMMGIPIHIGSNTGAFDRFLRWGNNLSGYCCQEGGVEFGGITANVGKYYKSRQVTTATSNADDVLSFFPGTVKFITDIRNTGNFARRHANSWLARLPVAEVPGLVLDFTITEDPCEQIYLYKHSLYYTIWTPEGLYLTGDAMEGVNGIVVSEVNQVVGP